MTDLELYNQAKEAYYNGTPIMDDYDFDELEEKLGLANKAYVGARHNPSYTVEHPFIMGSLSKVQIKEDDNGNIDFQKYVEEIGSYLFRNEDCDRFIVGPKYDGCSFEMIIDKDKVRSISTRGDGHFGKDIYKHIIHQFDDIDFDFPSTVCLRGEVLINKNVFNEKYSEFVNPRSFVSGVLNTDYDENDTDFINKVKDLSIVIYDTRILGKDGKWTDHDWSDFMLFKCIDNNPKFQSLFPQFSSSISKCHIVNNFEVLYNEYVQYRHDCEYALDGIVFKPSFIFREWNEDRERPVDCVAVKFVPMLETTEVVDIVWETKKTNELNPVVIVNPVDMDGKKITRASGHNYGYLIDNQVSVGTKIILSLAGDIIPYIYKIVDTSNFDPNKLNIPDIDTYVEGCHLYHKMTKEEETKMKFVSSCTALNIPNIGPAAADTIFEYMKDECQGDEFFGIEEKEIPNNILLVSPVDVDRALGGKTGKNTNKSMTEFLKNITIKDIIVSCCFDSCGNRIATEIEKYMLGKEYDFSHMAEKAYKWCFDRNSLENKQISAIMGFLGRSLEDYKEVSLYDDTAQNNAIPVILTGEPNGYASKGDFLKKHPEYRLTGSWKEVQIVFTNSLDSNTGKMKKAREKNIRIELY